MGRTDSTPENLKAIAGGTEPVDRLNLLNRWISTKLDELGAADERLAKRLEHLNTTEQSLKTLFEALRKQVAETHPVLKELSQLRATALTAVEQVVRGQGSIESCASGHADRRRVGRAAGDPGRRL